MVCSCCSSNVTIFVSNVGLATFFSSNFINPWCSSPTEDMKSAEGIIHLKWEKEEEVECEEAEKDIIIA